MATRKSSTTGGATRVSVAATAMIALRKMSLLSELDEEDLGGADEARAAPRSKTAPPQRRNSRDEELPVLS